MSDREPRKVDAETFLESFREGSELIGLGAPNAQMELQLLDALDKANEWAAQPYRALPRRRAAVVAFLRGIVSTLSEEGLQDLYRYQSDPNESTVSRWWDRGYRWTSVATFRRFDIYTCTGCKRRVHGPNTLEHDPSCRSHTDNYEDAWVQLRERWTQGGQR